MKPRPKGPTSNFYSSTHKLLWGKAFCDLYEFLFPAINILSFFPKALLPQCFAKFYSIKNQSRKEPNFRIRECFWSSLDFPDESALLTIGDEGFNLVTFNSVKIHIVQQRKGDP
jgi:hypothetical protein